MTGESNVENYQNGSKTQQQIQMEIIIITTQGKRNLTRQKGKKNALQISNRF